MTTSKYKVGDIVRYDDGDEVTMIITAVYDNKSIVCYDVQPCGYKQEGYRYRIQEYIIRLATEEEKKLFLLMQKLSRTSNKATRSIHRLLKKRLKLRSSNVHEIYKLVEAEKKTSEFEAIVARMRI